MLYWNQEVAVFVSASMMDWRTYNKSHQIRQNGLFLLCLEIDPSRSLDRPNIPCVVSASFRPKSRSGTALPPSFKHNLKPHQSIFWDQDQFNLSPFIPFCQEKNTHLFRGTTHRLLENMQKKIQIQRQSWLDENKIWLSMTEGHTSKTYFESKNQSYGSSTFMSLSLTVLAHIRRRHFWWFLPCSTPICITEPLIQRQQLLLLVPSEWKWCNAILSSA